MRKTRTYTLLIRAVCSLFVAVSLAAAGTSLDLMSPNGYAFTSDDPVFDFAGSFTIDLQFKSPAAHNGCLVAKFHQASGTAQDDSYYILVQSGGGIEARIQTLSMLVTLNAPGAVHDDQWHHVALVYDIDAQVAELYLDGELGDSATLSGALRDTEESVRLGTMRTTGGLASFYDGQIDELRFWNSARRGEQASCLKDVTLLLDTPGLTSYYSFDEGTGTTSNDLKSPFENLTFISGATFSISEPAILSRLSGAGACYCGNVTGVFSASDPAMTLVGDTVVVPEGDSLMIVSNSLTLDSTVSRVNVLGKLSVTGTASDSSFIFGQFAAASDAEIHFAALDPVQSQLTYVRLSGFSSRTLQTHSPISLSHTAVAQNPGGGLQIGAEAEFDSCLFTNCDSVAVVIDSGVVTLDGCDFTGNGGGLTISAPCSVTVKQSNFSENVKSLSEGGAIHAIGNFDGGTGSYLGIEDCVFENNAAGSGGAIRCGDMNVRIERSLFTANSAGEGGGLSSYANAGRVCRVEIDSTDFIGNSGTVGAAIHLLGTASTAPVEFSLMNSVVAGNSGTSGGLHGTRVIQISGHEALIERSLFYDNASAITLLTPYDASTVEFRNLTVVGNTGTGISVSQPLIVRNCIVIENDLGQISGSGPSVVYSITSDEEYLGGPFGNFNADPLFYDYLNRDLRLTAGSPAINRGDPNALYNDPDGTRNDIGARWAENFAPMIESVLDIPQDNGRQVMVQWLPSPGDDSRAGIDSYQIFREVNLPILENYELLAEIPASQLPGYGQIVSTIADSNQLGQPWFSYFVRAKSVNPLAFWDSEIDSGYSTDNLAPEVPALLAELVADDVELSWTASPDSDFAYFELYRAEVTFDPDTVAVYATRTDTFFTDVDLTGEAYAYRVKSVDHNGNRSDASNEQFIEIQETPAPQGFTVYPLFGFLVLRWLPVPNAVSYHVYGSDTPDGPGSLLATTPSLFHIEPIHEDIQFYWVTAER